LADATNDEVPTGLDGFARRRGFKGNDGCSFHIDISLMSGGKGYE
jgi:hypothetical protein